MKLLYYFAILLLPLGTLPKERISGRYICSDGSSITISGDSLVFSPGIIFSDKNSVIPPSICSIHKLAKNTYTIVSRNRSNIIKDYHISYGKHFSSEWEEERSLFSIQPTSLDSMSVCFQIPVDFPLKIEIHDLPIDTSLVFLYSSNNKCFKIHKKSLQNRLTFSFAPERIQQQEYTGQYLGIVEAFMTCIISGSPNEITISIPELNSAFFEQYYFDNDIIFIKHKCILWRNRSFIRTE